MLSRRDKLCGLWFALALALCSGNPPNFQGCSSTVANQQPYCDTTLDYETRAQKLVDALTLEEKVSLMSPNPEDGNDCDTHTSSVARLGLFSYMWLMETNSDVSSQCYGPEKCRTEFYGPLGHAASFNRTSWNLKGHVLSRELRAFRNIGWHRAVKPEPKELIGITAYGPNINILRDPRFGRASELPGEDPYLSGVLAGAMVEGMQEKDTAGHPRALAFLKHFTAYSMESNRGHDDHTISAYDLHDTYLRQYELAAKLGKPTGVMCSYAAVNGRPVCANSYLLNDVLRKRFQLPDAIVTTDCGAVANLLGTPINAPNGAVAAAYAVNNGTDLEMGSQVLGDAKSGLVAAVKQGLVSEEVLNAALLRMWTALMRGGLFDEFGKSEHDTLSGRDINSTYHRSIQWDAALQAPVLLRNDAVVGGTQHRVLPLQKGAKVVVLGPMAAETNIHSDYANRPACWNDTTACIWTLQSALRQIGGSNVINGGLSQGELDRLVLGEEGKARAAVAQADYVVLALGITKVEEHEGVDRSSTDLPMAQRVLADQVLQAKKPTVIVLVNGGQLSVDKYREWNLSPLAVVEAFNPNSEGMKSVAAHLYGTENRWGKLPYTMYPSIYQTQVDFNTYDMSAGMGRTYRYYKGKALWPFGYGLSYTTFAISSCFPLQRSIHKATDRIRFSCAIENSGALHGDEVVQVYHVAPDKVRNSLQDKHPVPIKSLVDFERVSVAPKADKEVVFLLCGAAVSLCDENGDRQLRPGVHSLLVTLGSRGGSSPALGSSFTVDVVVMGTTQDALVR